MKKKLYLLFGLIMSLLLVGVVKAEGPYIRGWETEKLDNEEYAYYNVQYQDGYITLDDIEDVYGTLVTIYDANGNILKEKEFHNKYVDNILVDGDRILFVEEDWTSGSNRYFVREYNNKLVLQHEIQVYRPYYDYYSYDYPLTSLMRIDGDLYYIGFGSAIGFLKLEEDLSSYEDLYGEEYEKKLPETIINKARQDHNIKNMITADIDGERILIGAEKTLDIYGCVPNSPTNGDSEEVRCTVPHLFYIKDGELTDIEVAEDYYEIKEVKFIDEYLVAILEDEDGNEHILVYDEKGTVVQDIELEGRVYGIEDTDRGFIVNETACSTRGANYSSDPSGASTKSPVKDVHQKDQRCNEHHTVYTTIHEIKSEITAGKGKVEVINHETPGNPVTFVVTPDKGYTLGTIKVTDSKGNVITFTKDELKGNTFTMPSADVIIEVEFLVQNAATADIAITLMFILAILSAIVILVNKRKLLETK